MNTNSLLQEIKDLTHIERIGSHSHIRGLGITKEGSGSLQDLHIGEGMVGQWKARRAASLIVSLVKQNKISGRGILLAGKPGTGKTAIAMGIAQSLSSDLPFNSISASEVFSLTVSRTEALTQAIRKSVGVRIKESTEVVEGEVVEISLDHSQISMSSGIVGKVTLRTTDMEAIYDLGSRMIQSLKKERITPGDVISIDKASGRITRLGRSYGRARDFDATGADVKFVGVPEGELQHTRSQVHTVTLHDIDVVNSSSRSSATSNLLALFSGDTGEIRQEVRDSINSKVKGWIEEGKCEVIPGVLFIDEVHMLDVECFSFLNRAIEGSGDSWAPLLVMASNRGVTRIRGTNYEAPHGIPADFLDRLLIIATKGYEANEIREIIKIRATEEDVQLSEEALVRLVEIAVEASGSLRYAMQLIMTANCARLRRKANNGPVEVSDIERVYSLFWDVKRSSSYLKEHEAVYMQFN